MIGSTKDAPQIVRVPTPGAPISAPWLLYSRRCIAGLFRDIHTLRYPYVSDQQEAWNLDVICRMDKQISKHFAWMSRLELSTVSPRQILETRRCLRNKMAEGAGDFHRFWLRFISQLSGCARYPDMSTRSTMCQRQSHLHHNIAMSLCRCP